ncbi:MAG: tRNA pseudouridine(13) synthase TruD [Gammaproteobacteria bacterium]|nr:tRNA pseudouridine(13) synthase TruD [Gammaproteobacteria bacterium]MDH3408898.1 tRNA pseudouridine(13) synthase TruD [Gammaproteobacteria bacterium]MDH3553288.1 tRNA pseudouridine(13) synthase TruD [Gammaproteobacteria bacterium]
MLPDWARALGPTPFAAVIRTIPDDFVVIEQIGIEFSDDGEHDWLWIEKTGANTHWVAERLAKHARVSPRDVGFAGLKDRHAVTRQWFSVRRPSANGTEWDTFESDGVRIVEQRLHRRKLRRGAHRGNAFRIALRGDEITAHPADVAERLAEVESRGVPNYFGEQRFGRDGSNIDLGRAVLNGRRVTRNKRSIAISAVRSLLFNDILDARVHDGTWDKILPGEVASLDGSGSVFAVDEVTDEIEQRCAGFDIHPSGTLWGRNAPLGTGTIAELETDVVSKHGALATGLIAAKVDAASRPLRVRVQDLKWEVEDDALWLHFRLSKGAYATSVLREIVSC